MGDEHRHLLQTIESLLYVLQGGTSPITTGAQDGCSKR